MITTINMCIVFILALVCIVLYILFKNDLKNINYDFTKSRSVNFPGRFSENLKRDCNIERVLSMLDSQCDDICLGPDTFRSSNGVCVNTVVFEKSVPLDECNPKLGVVAYLIGDTQLGRTRLQCLSIDPGIQPNNPKAKNIICGENDDDGFTNINYLESFPQIDTCRCEYTNQTPIVIANTESIRKRAVCVDKKSLKLFQYNRLTLEDQTGRKTEKGSRIERN
uniref:PIF-3 n=1 Tax=Nilaparvata lugens endogenous nudivirus TaxID=1487700 RepID=X5GF53_9VIRU|nr:PIF-3 [Nilaparvata lugens endogenous nudivirus]